MKHCLAMSTCIPDALIDVPNRRRIERGKPQVRVCDDEVYNLRPCC